MKLKVIQNYNSDFHLDPDAKATLFTLLENAAFLKQVCPDSPVAFTELLFQPVPYSPATPKGMPSEFEAYHNSPDYIIVNVPPNFMFQAKIFQPSRLCAVYKKH